MKPIGVVTVTGLEPTREGWHPLNPAAGCPQLRCLGGRLLADPAHCSIGKATWAAGCETAG